MRLSPDKAAAEPSTTAGLSRRVVLAGLVTAYTASLIPWALAESAPDVDRGNFLILSALIAGREGLDNELAIRYYDALLENDEDRKSTRLNSSHVKISYAVFCLKKKT